MDTNPNPPDPVISWYWIGVKEERDKLPDAVTVHPPPAGVRGCLCLCMRVRVRFVVSRVSMGYRCDQKGSYPPPHRSVSSADLSVVHESKPPLLECALGP